MKPGGVRVSWVGMIGHRIKGFGVKGPKMNELRVWSQGGKGGVGGHTSCSGASLYLSKRFFEMVSLKPIYPQTRQLNLTVPCYKVTSTGLWVTLEKPFNEHVL